MEEASRLEIFALWDFCLGEASELYFFLCPGLTPPLLPPGGALWPSTWDPEYLSWFSTFKGSRQRASPWPCSSALFWPTSLMELPLLLGQIQCEEFISPFSLVPPPPLTLGSFVPLISSELSGKAPWLIGSIGTLSLDVSIYLQVNSS